MVTRQCPLLYYALVIILATSCAANRKSKHVEMIRLPIAGKTSRKHVVTECVITLHGFSYTVEYAQSDRDFAALRTHWREQVYQSSVTEEAFKLRDRATLHLSPRGIQSTRAETLVGSTLEFELEKVYYDEKKKKWLTERTAPSAIQHKEFEAIASDLQRRLQLKGYIFN